MFNFLRNIFKVPLKNVEPRKSKEIWSEAAEREIQCSLNQWTVSQINPKIREEKWDRRFLGLAKYISSFSLDPSTKVGAVIVDDDNRIISVGYNGLPKGICDSEERLNNREWKLSTIIHGEINALNFAERSVKGCTLFTFPFMPCSRCSSIIIQRGIKRVVAPFNDNERWRDSFKITSELFEEARVELVLYKDLVL